MFLDQKKYNISINEIGCCFFGRIKIDIQSR